MKTPMIIDVTHFKEAGISNNLIVDFLRLYAADMLTLPDQFSQLMLVHDYLGAEQLLHSYKGACEVVGAYRVSALMQRLEKLIKTDDQLFDPELLVAEFKQGVKVTLVGVKKLVTELSYETSEKP